MTTTLFKYTTFAACLALCLLAPFNSSLWAEHSKVASRVTDVTLYRTQAMVTRTIDVELKAGASELLVSDLPENIIPASLFAEGNDQLEVRAVQFRTRAVGDSPREEVRKLREELEAAIQAISLNQKNSQLVEKQNQYLDKLEGFVAPTAAADLSKGVLDANALKEMTLFSFAQRSELAGRQIELASELKKLQANQSLLSRQLNEITNGASKTVREAIVFIQKNNDQPQTVRLNYLVGSCGWSPSYNARASQYSEQFRLEYNGLIQQMSGEDWTNVSLTLSSASPALSAAGPGLAPFQVTLTSLAGQVEAKQLAMAKGQNLQNLRSEQRRYNQAFQNSVNLVEVLDNNWSINDAANKIFCEVLTAEPNALLSSRSRLADAREQPAMNYTISSPVSLASRNTQQMVRIITTDLESNFYHVATPILTSYVYREAEINNTSQQDLLGGPITVYLDDRFVGRSEIPSVTRGQTFVVGFGADSQLRTRRELVEKKNSFTGGNRETRLTYRLIVENYKESPVSIRLIDRMPTVSDESNIRVTLLPLEDQLSKNETYVRLEAAKGILRWDTEVAARSVGQSAQEIEYGFTMEHDRQYQVSLPANLQKQKEEFRKLQNFRNRR